MKQNKEIILIAGGTGFIGKHLIKILKEKHEIRILTRNKEKLNSKNFYFWNPDENLIDETCLENVTVIINLCGEGIADKRWTNCRKKRLLESRVKPAMFLHQKVSNLQKLKLYLSASGINCYPLNNSEKFYKETDDFGFDFVSQLVKKWENAADLFKSSCNVVKLRIGFVIANNEGGITKIEKPIKMGVGAVLGSGNQPLPWIHIKDLIRLISFCIDKNLDGTYNANSNQTTNLELTNLLAKKNKRKIFLPNVPKWILKIILGELSNLLLTGVFVSNKKIKDEGFVFEQDNIEEVFKIN